ncbi:MAG: L,D-transpeptidase [Pseudomonadota bacterium]
MIRVLPRAAVLSGAVAALALGATASHAQSFWGFGGKNSVDDRTVVGFSSKYQPGEIVVSFGDRRLYYVTKRGQAISYPIAVPRPKSRWQGVLRVSLKRENPDWTPTPRMRKENPKLPAHVPGGHKLNPLGVRALYLGSTLYRIHGTDAPWTIGKNVSKGCVRMHNDHVVELYKRVGVGAKVTATWKKFKPPVISASGYGAGSSKRDTGWKSKALGMN